MSVLDSLIDAPRLAEGFGGAFDPEKHPRDWRGEFRRLVGELKVGEHVELPSGARVIREGKLTHTVKAPNGLRYSTSDVKAAADVAANAHDSILKRRAESRAGGGPRKRRTSSGIGAMAHLSQPRRHSIASVFPR